MERALFVIAVFAMSLVTLPVGAISKEQEAIIKDRCETIRENLKTVQKRDAKARVYLGGYYETILSKYMTPLNVRLVENNISDVALIENQNSFAKAKTGFAEDFVGYQKALEELVLMDCKNEPAKFYEELEAVRAKRAKMEKDMAKITDLTNKHRELVTELKGRM